MKKILLIIGFLFVAIAEIVSLIVFAVQTPDFSQNAVEVNEAVQSVKRDFGNMQEHINKTALDYVVLDKEGNILYKTKSGLSESENEAIIQRDTILDIKADNAEGKIIIYNDGVQTLQKQKQTAIIVLSVATAVQCAVCAGYAAYMYATMIKPFRKLKGFCRARCRR